MKKQIKKITAMIIVIFMVLPFIAIPASADLYWDFFGMRAKYQKGAVENGKSVNTFLLSAAEHLDVNYVARLYDAAGNKIFTWNTHTIPAGNTDVAKISSFDMTAIPSGKYKFIITGWTKDLYILEDGSEWWIEPCTCWSFEITHKNPNSPAKLSVKSVKTITKDDGSERIQIILNQEDGKGKRVTIEIYDSWRQKIYSTGVSMTYDKGTVSVEWDMYPAGGEGLRYGVGRYTIKYWIPNNNSPKEYEFDIS